VGITAIDFRTGVTEHIGTVFEQPREVSAG
jgi:hypothetical protein